MATIMEGAFQKALVADLNPGVRDFVGKIDSFMRNIVQERSAEVIGQDWISRRLIGTGESGAIRYGTSLNGPNEASVGSLAHRMESPDTYPGIAEMVYPGVHEIQLRLVRASVNLFVPLNMMRVDKLPAMRAKYIEKLLKGFAHKIASRKVRAFYKQAGASVSKIIGTIDSISAGGGTGVSTVTFAPTSSSIHSYQDGQLIEIWAAAGTTRRHSPGATLASTGKYVMVDGVDYIGGTVTAKVVDGTNWGSQILVGDVVIDYQDPAFSGSTIVSAAQTPHDPDGWEAWTKSSGNIYDSEAVTAVALGTHPYLKSLVKDMTTEFGSEVPLSNSLLNRYVGAFEHAYPDGDLTHLVTTSGVLRQMLDGFDNQVVFDAQGQAINPKLGFKVEGKGDSFYVPYFSPSGKMYKVIVGPCMRPGTLAGLNGNGNIFEVMAPDLGGSSGDGTIGAGEIEFVAPLHGSKNIWLPVTSSDAVTNVRQAPAELVHAFSCDDPRGLKLTSLQELSA